MTVHPRRLWLLIDAAGLDNGRADIDDSVFQELGCLFTGDLETELADCAPYLALVNPEQDGLDAALAHLVAKECAVVLTDRDPTLTFAQAHRHLRKFNVVYGPEGTPLFFRYYDARVLPSVLQALDAGQLQALFGPFDSIVLPDADAGSTRLTLAAGQLVSTPADVPLQALVLSGGAV